MKPCESCGKPDKRDTHDDCAHCGKRLCRECMAFGTCKSKDSPRGLHQSHEEFD